MRAPSTSDVIRHAVWLYLRFTLRNRDVEDLLAERGLMVSNESIRLWVRANNCQELAYLGLEPTVGGISTVCHEHSFCEGRYGAVWGKAPRGRQSGAGLKPLQAAIVKSGCGERCSKRRDEIPSGMSGEASESEPLDVMSKPEGTSSFRDKLGGWPEGCPSGLRHVRTLS